MWYDRDIDAMMHRTRGRPIPRGARRSRTRRLSFGVVLAVVLGHADGRSRSTGRRPALLAFTIVFYVFVYTMWLKRRTPQNIVIGGAAGAFPPMIGWAAVTGDDQPRLDRAVPAHLHVDAAAFLGAGALPRGRLRQGRRADAAGGGRRARDQAPDAALHACCCARSRWRRACARRRRRGLCGGGRRCSASLFILAARSRVLRDDDGERAAPGRCSPFRSSISSCCSRC